jgi:hypothetical protein
MACVVALLLSMQPVVFVRSAVAEPAAREMSVKEIRELVDEAEKLLEDGKPGKAAARLAEATKGNAFRAADSLGQVPVAAR